MSFRSMLVIVFAVFAPTNEDCSNEETRQGDTGIDQNPFFPQRSKIGDLRRGKERVGWRAGRRGGVAARSRWGEKKIMVVGG